MPAATDLPPALADLLDAALAQSDELDGLDAARAEAWASDLLALADEACDDGERLLVGALEGHGASAALWAIRGVRPQTPIPEEGAPPRWAGSVGTGRCEGAWQLTARGAASVVLRFVDADDVRHVVVVDLTAGADDGPETVGEVVVGPGDLLEVLGEEDARVDAVEVAPEVAAERIAAALGATGRPDDSAVANGRLLAARLATLTDAAVAVPRRVPEEVPPPPTHDPDDLAWALGILHRATPPGVVDPDALAAAARVLRAAADDDAPVARWLAASAGPVDLDAGDHEVVTAALAASAVPSTLAPFDPSVRDAVVTLEPADWLGAVIELVRRGEGAEVHGEALVDLVNRCPEVASSIPRADRARIGWAFDTAIAPWEPLGLVADGRLTAFGAAILPHVLDRAWAR